MTCGNPCPVVDRRTGVIWLPFCKNRADGPETMICEGKAPRTVWLMHSADDGVTWSQPVEITSLVKRPEWTWYATGPCHGIQLADGRLLVPCDHVVGRDFQRHTDPYHSHVILSDDAGRTWKIGGVVPEGTNECCIVETADGAIYLNARNKATGEYGRAFSWSRDRGDSFPELSRDPVLVEPVCQAGMTRFTTREAHGRDRVLFSNPARPDRKKREDLTVGVSYDECRSWNAGRSLHAGPAAYSDLAVAPDMAVLCLYERGEAAPYETITLARFSLAWLTRGRDRLA
jgi:sialidase-1